MDIDGWMDGWMDGLNNPSLTHYYPPGGAIAVLAEKAATDNLRLKAGEPMPKINTMKISYMSPVRDIITLRAHQAAPHHTIVEYSGGDFITTTCHINWDKAPRARL